MASSLEYGRIEAGDIAAAGSGDSSSGAPLSVTKDISVPGFFAQGLRPKAAHNSIFVAWILRTFGQENLRSQGGVIDIAGGNGGLSFDLSVRFGISCTVVDPRDITLSTILRRRMKKITEKRTLGCYFHEKMPEHLRAEPDDGLVLDEVEEAVRDESRLPFGHIRERFELPLTSDTALQVAVQNADLIVGMHPDSAACDIVDAAIHFNKPFAVLPCCVFPELFHDRFIGSKPVRSYNDLVQYIKAKDSSIQELELPFIGKNKVLFKLKQ